MSIPACAGHCLLHLPITHRIAIGNALIITFGAVDGAFPTRHLGTHAIELWLALLFLSLGITASLLANFWIVRSALQSLHNQAIIVNQMDHHPKQVLSFQHLGFLEFKKEPDWWVAKQLSKTLQAKVRELMCSYQTL